MDDLVERNDLYYKKFTDVPFTGKVTGEWEGKIKNGKREGTWNEYHSNGQLWSKGKYKDGEQEGLWEFYNENGKLVKKRNFKDGVEVK